MKLIKQKYHFTAFLSNHCNKSKMNKEKYLEYEYQCMLYHQQHHINSIVYHWSVIPLNILKDIGFIHDYNESRILRKKGCNETEKMNLHDGWKNMVREYGLDGLAIVINGDDKTYHVIQSKCWNDNSYLTAKDLGTFLSVFSFRIQVKHQTAKGFIYYTGRVQSDLRDDIINSKGNIILQHLPFTETLVVQHKNDIITKLRYYQINAIHNLSNENKWIIDKTIGIVLGLLHMPCGSGKTMVVSQWSCSISPETIIIILSPTRALSTQNLECFSIVWKHNNVDFEHLLVTTDGKVEERTKEGILTKMIKSKKLLISSTHKSMEIVLSALKETKRKAVVIVDEAHNVLNSNGKTNILFNETKNYIEKILFVTATPPKHLHTIKENLNIVYDYPLTHAIKDKIISDYRIYVPVEICDNLYSVHFSEYYYSNKNNEFDHTTESNQINKECTIIKDAELLGTIDLITKKAIFLCNSMIRTGCRRCIVYLLHLTDCQDFIKRFQAVCEKYLFMPHYTDIITGETLSKKRELILQEFQKNGDLVTLRVIASVKVLDEGIDIPSCDSVFLASINKSTNPTKTVQRISRSTRIDYSNPNKIAACFIWTNDIHAVIDCLDLLKENDTNFLEKIKVVCNDNEIIKLEEDNTTELEQLNTVSSTKINPKQKRKVQLKQFVETTEISYEIAMKEYFRIKCMSCDESFLYFTQQLKEFVKNKSCVPSNSVDVSPLLRTWYINLLSSVLRKNKKMIKSSSDIITSSSITNENLQLLFSISSIIETDFVNKINSNCEKHEKKSFCQSSKISRIYLLDNNYTSIITSENLFHECFHYASDNFNDYKNKLFLDYVDLISKAITMTIDHITTINKIIEFHGEYNVIEVPTVINKLQWINICVCFCAFNDIELPEQDIKLVNFFQLVIIAGFSKGTKTFSQVINHDSFKYHKMMLYITAVYGTFQIYDILCEKKYEENYKTSYLCTIASYFGQLQYLKYVHIKGCNLSTLTSYFAITSNHWKCFIYAHEHGCLWSLDQILKCKSKNKNTLSLLAAIVKGGETKFCFFCNITSTTNKFCGKCGKISYCSKICQIQDWKRHKLSCKYGSSCITHHKYGNDEGKILIIQRIYQLLELELKQKKCKSKKILMDILFIEFITISNVGKITLELNKEKYKIEIYLDSCTIVFEGIDKTTSHIRNYNEFGYNVFKKMFLLNNNNVKYLFQFVDVICQYTTDPIIINNIKTVNTNLSLSTLINEHFQMKLQETKSNIWTNNYTFRS